MKNNFLMMILILIFSFSINIYAKDTLNEQYKTAMTAYKNKDFQTSYTILSKLYLSRLSDSNLSFELGRSAYETGNYEIALAAFERVEMLDEGNPRNKLEMARTYFMLKMYEDAQLLFNDVLSNKSIPDTVRKNIELYLTKVSKVQKKSFTFASVGVDLVYDSNINYASLDSSYTIGNLILPTAKKERGSAVQSYGNITNIYDIGEKNGFAIKNTISTFIKRYNGNGNSDFNLNYLSYNPSLLYSETKYSFELEGGFDFLTLGNHDYLHSLSISPKLKWNHTTTLNSSVYFKYAIKDYQQKAQKELDASHFELSYSLQKILTPRSYVQGQIVKTKEKKKNGSRVDVDYDEYKLNLSYVNQFNATYAVALTGEIKEKKYDDYSTLFNNKRKDKSKSLSTSLNITIMPTLKFRVKGTYNKVNSTQSIYSYNKTTITTGLVKTF